MNLPHQPVCTCLECRHYGLVYSSLLDSYSCNVCESLVKAQHVEGIVLAYGVYRSKNPPILIPNYNSICCYSCLETGGIEFKGLVIDSVFCSKCKYQIHLHYLYEAMASSYKTKLIEKTYNTVYSVFGEG